jgi:hypothetical protein
MRRSLNVLTLTAAVPVIDAPALAHPKGERYVSSWQTRVQPLHGRIAGLTIRCPKTRSSSHGFVRLALRSFSISVHRPTSASGSVVSHRADSDL